MTNDNDQFISSSVSPVDIDRKQIILKLLGEQDQCIWCNKFVPLTLAEFKNDRVEYWYHCSCGKKQGMIWQSQTFAERFKELFGERYEPEKKEKK